MEWAEKVPTKNVLNMYDPRSTPVLIYVATELISWNPTNNHWFWCIASYDTVKCYFVREDSWVHDMDVTDNTKWAIFTP